MKVLVLRMIPITLVLLSSIFIIWIAYEYSSYRRGLSTPNDVELVNLMNELNGSLSVQPCNYDRVSDIQNLLSLHEQMISRLPENEHLNHMLIPGELHAKLGYIYSETGMMEMADYHYNLAVSLIKGDSVSANDLAMVKENTFRSDIGCFISER